MAPNRAPQNIFGTQKVGEAILYISPTLLKVGALPQTALPCRPVDHDHIGLKSWKLIARNFSPTPSFFVAQRSSTSSQATMERFLGD